MTPAEINARIAELCGWSTSVGNGDISILTAPDGRRWESPNRSCCELLSKYAPKYHGSLDACALFEVRLTDHEYEWYRIHLWDIVTNREKPRHNPACPTRFERAFLSATAPQRCEAFLAVIGKGEK